jgi:hypothetical protein
MTVLVGICCRDGVVIGADSSATSAAGQIRTIEQPVKKLFIVGDDCLFAGTGQIGLGQRFHVQLESVVTAPGRNRMTIHDIVKTITVKSRKDFGETGVQGNCFGALVALPSQDKHELCEFAATDLQPELKHDEKLWFVSMGSGQLVTDPFLAFMRRVYWEKSRPDVTEGVLLTYWALRHAIDVNTGGVNSPMQIGVLAKNDGRWKARLLAEDELDEHEGFCNDVERHMASYSLAGRQVHSGPPQPMPPEAGQR